MSLEELKAICPVFESDIYDAISLKTCVEKDSPEGAPSPAAMKDAIARYEEYLSE